MLMFRSVDLVIITWTLVVQWFPGFFVSPSGSWRGESPWWPQWHACVAAVDVAPVGVGCPGCAARLTAAARAAIPARRGAGPGEPAGVRFRAVGRRHRRGGVAAAASAAAFAREVAATLRACL